MFSNDCHKVKDCEIGQRDLSDHSWQKAKNYSMNWLNSYTFKTKMADELTMYLEHIDNGEVSPAILWDTAKAFLRGKL